jgi:ribonuclease HII
MIKIADVRKQLEEADEKTLFALLQEFETDSRQGVQKLCSSFRKRQEKLEKEKLRLEKMCEEEEMLSEGLLVAGIDEAGRGPLAGPVVAAAVIMPKDSRLLYVNDSKKLSQAKREELYTAIMEEAISVGVGVASPEVIDKINILQATYQAMREAVCQLNPTPEILLNDAVIIPEVDILQKGLVKGDARCYSIASASIIAKVTRDRMMEEFDKLYPVYGFKSHKGYGSSEHIKALKEYGPCPIHRSSFIGHFI